MSVPLTPQTLQLPITDLGIGNGEPDLKLPKGIDARIQWEKEGGRGEGGRAGDKRAGGGGDLLEQDGASSLRKRTSCVRRLTKC